jgi:hypothetical protein
MEKTTSNERSYFENQVPFALLQTYALRSLYNRRNILLELLSSKLGTATAIARAGGTGSWVWGNSTVLGVGLRICQGLKWGRQLPILLGMWGGGGGIGSNIDFDSGGKSQIFIIWCYRGLFSVREVAKG